MSESGYRDCPFCRVESSRVVAANDLAFVVRDQYPVSPGHSLVIPKRHVADWWSTAPQERAAIDALVDTVKEGLDREFSPAGYNVGFNDRAAAGQTVFHLHVHVIPRFEGDVDDPRGGIRHVLPARANYLLEPESDGGLDSPIESRLGETIDSSALIQRVLAVSGRRTPLGDLQAGAPVGTR
jgi:diadenosine tetraphosphate (Ap4A) HIT family hydrolase